MKEKVKNFIKKLVGIEDTPQKIAFGFAIGVFWGVFPTIGIGAILAVLCASLFKANKIASIAGTLAGLPIFGLIYTIASIVIGGLILGNGWHDIIILIKEIREEGWRHIMKYALSIYSLGIVILSLLLASISYPIVFYITKAYRQKIKQ